MNTFRSVFLNSGAKLAKNYDLILIAIVYFVIITICSNFAHYIICKKTSMEELLKYFPKITDKQKEQFAALYDLYKDWNEKINVISRKDIDNLYLHHVLHSLAIAKAVTFRP